MSGLLVVLPGVRVGLAVAGVLALPVLLVPLVLGKTLWIVVNISTVVMKLVVRM